jgi:hypothetical protein
MPSMALARRPVVARRRQCRPWLQRGGGSSVSSSGDLGGGLRCGGGRGTAALTAPVHGAGSRAEGRRSSCATTTATSPVASTFPSRARSSAPVRRGRGAVPLGRPHRRRFRTPGRGGVLLDGNSQWLFIAPGVRLEQPIFSGKWRFLPTAWLSCRRESRAGAGRRRGPEAVSWPARASRARLREDDNG